MARHASTQPPWAAHSPPSSSPGNTTAARPIALDCSLTYIGSPNSSTSREAKSTRPASDHDQNDRPHRHAAAAKASAANSTIASPAPRRAITPSG
eukprot:CAMPEP_0182909382 /NCGR_PEP_ID=MMETSP0034_2-20130328/35724_1 /TAXON_ID=156128 /ORGANISM="Nephroselmis pyriformis, Strain CCMP717" /LENGTH=94 /DNA_ID=CAMNT_0025045633 /DNA_START=211 /DNA_END=498 /DNA_ORIENTATION=+